MRELNWTAEESAELDVLGDGPRGIPARIREYSAKRIFVAAELTLKGGTPVRVEWAGQLLLGQVLNSEPGGFWVEIHHMLLNTAGLNWQKQGWQRS